MIVDKITETSYHQLFNWKRLRNCKYLLKRFQVFFLKIKKLFFLDELRYNLFEKISSKQSNSLIFMLTQLDVIVSQLFPKNIENFDSSARVKLQNFVYFFKTKRTSCLISLFFAGCQKSPQETNNILKMQFMSFVNEMFNI